MRRLHIALLVIVSLFMPLMAVATVSAAEGNTILPACDDVTQNSPVCQDTQENPVSGSSGIIMKVVNILAFVIGAAAVIMVILGGFKYITSSGDPNSVSSAKNTILYAIIGVVVALLARSIVAFILTKI